MNGWRARSIPEPPNSHKLRETKAAARLLQDAFQLAWLLQPLPFMGNMLHFTVQNVLRNTSVPGALFAGRPLRVCGVGELGHQSFDQSQQP